jgi:hypothetical protein
MDRIMSLLELSQRLLDKVTNLNNGVAGIGNSNVLIKNYVDLDSEQITNLKELESKFNGNVEIVVHGDPKNIGPCTMPGIDDIIRPNIDPINIFKSWSNIIAGLGLKVDKVGEAFNVSSNTKIVMYIPPWFLSNELTKGGTDVFELTDETRVGILLHELGHWESLGSISYLLSSLVKLLGIFLFFYGTSRLFKKVTESEVEENKKPVVETSTLKNIIAVISGLLLFIIVSKILGTQAEISSDNFAKQYGYGKHLAEYVKNIDIKTTNTSKTFNSLFSIIEELVARVKSGYPSLDWRVQNLLAKNVTENEEYLTEFNFSLFTNPFETFLNKLNSAISKLVSLKDIRRITNIKTKRSINENINLLIINSFSKL